MKRIEHWLLCDDCCEGIHVCGCERLEDHHTVLMPHPEYRKPKIFPTLCGQCSHEREMLKPDYKV